MKSLVVASVLLAGGNAWAAPVGSASEDVTGDGAKDALEVAADGTVTLGTATVQLGRVIKQARIEVGQWKGKPIVVVVTDAKASILVPAGAGWKVALTTDIGAVGLDGEYATAVMAARNGVLRYQTRSGLTRCDGQPSLLFAEGFDGTKFRPLSTVPVNVDPAATTLKAKVDPASDAPMIYSARVASHQVGAGNAGGLVLPDELGDGKLTTQWHEELAGSAGEGQWFTFAPRVQVAATSVRIVPGNPTSAGAMAASSRPRTISIVGAGSAYRVELPDPVKAPLGTAYVVELPRPIAGCVSVVLEDTYGSRTAPTTIAELGVYAAGERTGGADPLLASIVVRGGEESAAAADGLGRRGAPAVAAIEAELAKTTDARARQRLVGALANNRDAAAIPPLARAAAEDGLASEFRLTAIRALVRLKASAELATLASSPRLSTDLRIAAVAGIGAEPLVLLRLAGQGAAELRRVVIDQLERLPINILLPGAAASENAAAAGDIWRAVTRSAKRSTDDRARIVATMSAALAAATDYERRYRLIDGLATLGDAPTLSALAATLAALPAGPQTAALRQVAIAGVLAAPRTDAIAFVALLARDPDPGVRLAVIAALEKTETDADGAWHAAEPDGIDRILLDALKADTWPDVRRRAATALSLRCVRPGPRAGMVDAALKDRDVDVRGDALLALVTCRAPSTGELLAKVWSDGDAPIALRTQAVGLSVALDDAELAVQLVGLFQKWRGAAIESEAALALAQSAARAIALLDAPNAAKALTDALDDEAFDEIVTAAANALGSMELRCPPAAKQRLAEIGASESQSSQAAKNAAQRCGVKAR